MGWNFSTNIENTRGNRQEPDVELASGTIIALRNNDFSYGETHYWGVLLCLDYQLLAGSDPLFHNQVLLYQKSHTLVLVNPVGTSVQPAFYYPDSAKAESVSAALFIYSP